MRFIRFLIVGGINTLFGYGIYAFFIFLGLHHNLAILVATFLGIAFNFKTIGKFVFNQNKSNLSHIVKFIGVYTFSYILNSIGVTILLKIVENPYMVGFFVLIPVSIIIYILNKNFVFIDSSPKGDDIVEDH